MFPANPSPRPVVFELVYPNRCLLVLGIALVLTITNSLAFSRCDKFSQASNLAGSALYSSNLAGTIATGMMGRFFSRS